MNEGESFENREKEPEFGKVRVFRVRHGKSEYKELQEEIDDDTTDITSEGERQIEDTLEYLKSVLDKDRDIVVFAHSPRRRAVDSMSIIYNGLKSAGFEVVDDPKGRESQERLGDARLFDKDENIVEPGTNEYAKAIWDVVTEPYEKYGDEWFKEGWAKNEENRIQNDEYELESLSEVKKRSKDHLSFLIRVAKKVQPKIIEQNKNLAIIEVIHGEGMDAFLEHATKGEKTLAGDGEIENGGVIEMDIPTKGQTIKSKSWTKNGGEEKMRDVKFDYLKRDFVEGV